VPSAPGALAPSISSLPGKPGPLTPAGREEMGREALERSGDLDWEAGGQEELQTGLAEGARSLGGCFP
jgi:hypothetical protein